MDILPDAGNSERLYGLHIFCDFDGTISGRDIGYDLFATFGRQEPWHTQLLDRTLPIREYWLAMARNPRGPPTGRMLAVLSAPISSRHAAGRSRGIRSFLIGRFRSVSTGSPWPGTCASP